MVVLVSFFRFWTLCIILDSVYYYSVCIITVDLELCSLFPN